MRALYHDDVAPDGTRLTTSQRRHKYPDKTVQLAAAQERIDAKVTALGRFTTRRRSGISRSPSAPKVRGQTPFIDLVVSFEKSIRLVQVGVPCRGEAGAGRGPRRGGGAVRSAGRADRSGGRGNGERTSGVDGAARCLRAHRPPLGDVGGVAGRGRPGRRRVPAAHQPGRRAEPPRAPGDPEPGAARGRSGRKWRALDGKPLWADRLYFGAVATRIMARKVAEKLGLVLVKQEDGNGFDIGGVERDTMAAYSKRSGEVDARKREMIAGYERDHGGRAPDRTALYKLRKQATLDTREAKEHPPEQCPRSRRRKPPGGRFARWMRTAENEIVQLLETLPGAERPLRRRAGIERDAGRGGAGPRHPGRRGRGPAAELHVDARETDLGDAPGARPAPRWRQPGRLSRGDGRRRPRRPRSTHRNQAARVPPPRPGR